MKKHIYFPSSDGKTRLHGVIWEPMGKPRAIVQIAHGMVEYVERYEGLAAFLNEHGILAAGNDHLGHGDSCTAKEKRGYFAEKRNEIVPIQDMHRLTLLLQKKYPNIPHFLFGHSMGSFFTRRYLCRYPHEIDGVILSGTGWQPKLLIKGARLLTAAGILLRGEGYRCTFIDNLAFGSMNRKFEPAKTPKDWLCGNEKTVDSYIKDEKCGFIFTLNGYRALFSAIDHTEDRKELAKMEKSLPVLFLSGEDDPVGDFGRGVKRAVSAFHQVGMEDVECILYPKCRHELINEKNREEVFQDMLEWLEFRI